MVSVDCNSTPSTSAIQQATTPPLPEIHDEDVHRNHEIAMARKAMKGVLIALFIGAILGLFASFATSSHFFLTVKSANCADSICYELKQNIIVFFILYSLNLLLDGLLIAAAYARHTFSATLGAISLNIVLVVDIAMTITVVSKILLMDMTKIGGKAIISEIVTESLITFSARILLQTCIGVFILFYFYTHRESSDRPQGERMIFRIHLPFLPPYVEKPPDYETEFPDRPASSGHTNEAAVFP